MTPRVVGQRGNAERAGVGGHVESIGEQGHGAERQPCDNLAHHHRSGERDYEPGATLVAAVIGAEKNVRVAPTFGGIAMHARSPTIGRRSHLQVFGDLAEAGELLPDLVGQGPGHLNQMVVNVIEDQGLLALLERFDDGLKLLGDVEPVAPFGHHVDHRREVALGTAQPLQEFGVVGVTQLADPIPLEGG